MKKVAFGPKPSAGSKSGSPDDWVHDRDRSPEPIKRLTIDIPESLHRRVKTACVIENLIMADVVRDMLDQRFPAKEPGPSPLPVDTEPRKHDEA